MRYFSIRRGQKEAVRAVLLADDLVIGVQGLTGSSKTMMLHEVRAHQHHGIDWPADPARDHRVDRPHRLTPQNPNESTLYYSDRRPTCAPNNNLDHCEVVGGELFVACCDAPKPLDFFEKMLDSLAPAVEITVG